jgi:hypothetical protein
LADDGAYLFGDDVCGEGDARYQEADDGVPGDNNPEQVDGELEVLDLAAEHQNDE